MIKVTREKSFMAHWILSNYVAVFASSRSGLKSHCSKHLLGKFLQLIKNPIKTAKLFQVINFCHLRHNYMQANLSAL